ncbi:MAG: hypothetical protein WED00_09035 [Aquisalimonadaceae bacterium]
MTEFHLALVVAGLLVLLLALLMGAARAARRLILVHASLPFAFLDYLALMDWIGRAVLENKRRAWQPRLASGRPVAGPTPRLPP